MPNDPSENTEADGQRQPTYLRFYPWIVSQRGLYEIDSGVADDDKRQQQTKLYWGNPRRLRINAQTDLFSTILSLLTLFFLMATAHFTARQWIASERSADASTNAAWAAHDGAIIAANALKENKRQFDNSNRPWLAPDPSVEVRQSVTDIVIPIKNYGSVPAVNVGVDFSSYKVEDVNRGVISKRCELAKGKANDGIYIVPGSNFTYHQHSFFIGEVKAVAGCIAYSGQRGEPHHSEVCLNPIFRKPNQETLEPCPNLSLKAD